MQLRDGTVISKVQETITSADTKAIFVVRVRFVRDGGAAGLSEPGADADGRSDDALSH